MFYLIYVIFYLQGTAASRQEMARETELQAPKEEAPVEQVIPYRTRPMRRLPVSRRVINQGQ
jgi:hypothetical protein